MFDHGMNAWAKALGDHPIVHQMMLEDAAQRFGKRVENLTIRERYSGSVKLEDVFERLKIDGERA